MRIVFFGTSSFAERVLSFLTDQGVSVVAIVTRPDVLSRSDKAPLISPVKAFALKKLSVLPIYQPEKASQEDFFQNLVQERADLFVVVAYGQILKQRLLDLPRLGAINVHGSFLPKYRGAAPMQRCLMAGERETGISIIKMTAQLDAGDVFAAQKLSVPETMTLGELQEVLSAMAGPLLLKVITDLSQGKAVGIPQVHEEATYAPKILPEECKIDWNKTTEQIYNLIRALSPSPGAWSWVTFNGEKKRVKIFLSRILSKEDLPSDLSITNGRWILPSQDRFLEVLEVQLEGKKRMAVVDFLRGVKDPRIQV